MIWKAFQVVVAARLFLWILPLERARKLLASNTKARSVQKHPVERVVWSVRVVSQLVPRSTCLVQAVAAQSLLSRQDVSSSLVIGVALEQGFQAHAWVEYGGRIIIGEVETTQYKRLMVLDS